MGGGGEKDGVSVVGATMVPHSEGVERKDGGECPGVETESESPSFIEKGKPRRQEVSATVERKRVSRSGSQKSAGWSTA